MESNAETTALSGTVQETPDGRLTLKGKTFDLNDTVYNDVENAGTIEVMADQLTLSDEG